MLLSRTKCVHIRLLQPAVDDLGCGMGADRTTRQPRVRNDAHKGAYGLPGKSHRFRSREYSFQPRARRGVLRGALVVGIDQEVGVNNDQRCSGPSSSSITLSTLSKSYPSGRPRLMGVTTNGLRADLRAA